VVAPDSNPTKNITRITEDKTDLEQQVDWVITQHQEILGIDQYSD